MRPWFLICLLLGADTASAGELDVPVGARAALWRLPPASPQVVELALQGVEGDLGWLTTYDTPGIDKISPLPQGGGSWLLRLHLARPGTRLQASLAAGVLSLDAVPASAAAAAEAAPAIPTLEALLAGDAGEIPPPDALPALHFLSGPALSFRWDPEDYPLSFDVLPQLAPAEGMAGIDAARAKVLALHGCDKADPACIDQQAAADLELGWRYLEKGWAREGRHYIERLATQPGSITPAEVALARAEAAIETGRWDEARARLIEAHQAGADSARLAEAIGLISLASGSPPPAPTGRMLAEIAPSPQAQLLAAELLQIGGRFAESLPLLQPLPDKLEGEEKQRAALRLGDAILLTGGDPESARQAWNAAPPELGKYRQIYSTVMKAGRAGWVRLMPYLHKTSLGEGEVAAEALYLSAQIDAALGIPLDAIEELGRFLDDHPRIARRSDAPSLLWQQYAERVRALAAGERWYQLAALHRSTWRPLLHGQVDDPTVLWEAAKGFDRLGLPREAVDALAEGFEVMVERDQHNPAMTLELARLYERDGRPSDGLKTLNYLRKEGLPEGAAGEVALLTGRMQLGTGETAAALVSLKQAQRDPAQKDAATVLLAQIDAAAGRCGAAAPPLRRLLLTADEKRWPDPTPYLALARCEADLHQRAAALDAAQRAYPKARSEEEGKYIAYLVALYSGGAATPPVPAPPPAPVPAEAAAPAQKVEPTAGEAQSDDSIWTLLAEEQRKKAEFDADLKSRLR